MCHVILYHPAEVRDLKSAAEWSDALERAVSSAQEKNLPLEVFKVAEQIYLCTLAQNCTWNILLLALHLQ